MKKSSLLFMVLTIHGAASADDILNIRTNPFMVLGGTFLNLELDVRTSEHWAVGPFVQTKTMEPLFDAGLRATYFEQGSFQEGWMTGVELFYRRTDADNLYYNAYADSFCSYETTEICGLRAKEKIVLSIDHGYLWRHGTFNVGLGAGAAIQTDLAEPSEVALLPSLHFSLGWVR